MDFMYIFWVLFGLVGYFCGVRQGKENARNELERIKEKTMYEKKQAEEELVSCGEFRCSPCDDSKRTRLDREQWERDTRLAREQLPQKIEKLKNEIACMGNLLTGIGK